MAKLVHIVHDALLVMVLDKVSNIYWRSQLFDNARLGYDSVVLVRRRPTTEIQDGGRRNRK